jgi:hypothetical protein
MKKLIITTVIAAAFLAACSTPPKDVAESVAIENVEISEQEKSSAIISGKTIAQNTFKTLGGNLKKAMAQGGVENAINYCNANASGLIDSLGTHHNAIIRRTSNKLRNPNNAPTKAEELVLNKYLNGEQSGPVIDILASGNKIFYAPIKMKPLCITCHGTVGKTTSENDYATILKHYPNDKATGYNEGDFRGMWSIELKK